MIRRASVLLVLVASGLLLTSACKKEEEPQSIPVPSGAPSAAPVATDTPAPTDTAAAQAPSAVAPAATNPAATPQPGVNTKSQAQAGQSIERCCAALNTMSVLSGKSPESKAKAGAASKACYGIAKLVKDGKTTKAAAMTQIRSSLGDVSPPPECN